MLGLGDKNTYHKLLLPNELYFRNTLLVQQNTKKELPAELRDRTVLRHRCGKGYIFFLLH